MGVFFHLTLQDGFIIYTDLSKQYTEGLVCVGKGKGGF